MSDEVALELASQQVIKFLLNKQKFIEKWQNEVRRNLEQEDEGIDLRKPSTSSSGSENRPNPVIISIQAAILELTSTIHYVIDTFESNVDPRNCFLSSEKSHQNREAGELFDSGLRVEQLKSLKMENREIRNSIGSQIEAACRRVGLVLKTFGRKFQNQPSLEVSSLLPIMHKFCRLFFTISAETSRFADSFRGKNDRKLLRNVGKSVEKSANEFNLRVLAEMERIEKHLEKDEKRRKVSGANQNGRSQTPLSLVRDDYGIQTRRQHRLATSIQQVVNRRHIDSEDVMNRNERFRRPHPPGSIATSIVSKRRGFLIDDNLMKARKRIARVAPKPRPSNHAVNLNIDKMTPTEEDSDDVIMSSARKMADMVIEDMKKSIKF
ncbi:unnamed protein product [Caenorhabditis nigoni]